MNGRQISATNAQMWRK